MKEEIENKDIINSTAGVVQKNVKDSISISESFTLPSISYYDDAIKSYKQAFVNIKAIIDLFPKIDFNGIVNRINTIVNAIQNLPKIVDEQISPFVDFISKLALNYEAVPLYYNENLRQFREKYNDYLRTLCKCKWFPYIGMEAKARIAFTVINELGKHKYCSKRCIKSIDKIINQYYNDEKIKKIHSRWIRFDIDTIVKRIMINALTAFLRKEYALTAITLSSVCQAIIYEKVGKEGKKYDRDLKSYFDKLVDENKRNEILKSYFSDFVMYQCTSKSEVISDVPGRHGFSHGWFNEYPTRKAALNAIFLTDFLANCSPVLQT